jgi:hypothetical protein
MKVTFLIRSTPGLHCGMNLLSCHILFLPEAQHSESGCPTVACVHKDETKEKSGYMKYHFHLLND